MDNIGLVIKTLKNPNAVRKHNFFSGLQRGFRSCGSKFSFVGDVGLRPLTNRISIKLGCVAQRPSRNFDCSRTRVQISHKSVFLSYSYYWQQFIWVKNSGFVGLRKKLGTVLILLTPVPPFERMRQKKDLEFWTLESVDQRFTRPICIRTQLRHVVNFIKNRTLWTTVCGSGRAQNPISLSGWKPFSASFQCTTPLYQVHI